MTKDEYDELIDTYAELLQITTALYTAIKAFREMRQEPSPRLQNLDSRWRWQDVDNELGHAYECMVLELQARRGNLHDLVETPDDPIDD